MLKLCSLMVAILDGGRGHMTPMGKNVLKSSPLKLVSQYSKHVIDGPQVVNFQNCVQ
jgi:hypothetical protein